MTQLKGGERAARACESLVIARKESGADMARNPQKVRPNNSRTGKLVLLAGLMIGVSICSRAAEAQGATEPIWPTKEWQTSSPEEQGMDSKELAELVDFGARRILATPGVTLSSMLDSLLVVRHGKIVVEADYAPYALGSKRFRSGLGRCDLKDQRITGCVRLSSLNFGKGKRLTLRELTPGKIFTMR